jgi:hypothetical protein
LNTLHNTTAANPNALAESQALNPYFGSIHVPLALTILLTRIKGVKEIMLFGPVMLAMGNQRLAGNCINA